LLAAKPLTRFAETQRIVRATGLKCGAAIIGVRFAKSKSAPSFGAPMIRDCAITALLQRRLSTKASITRDAATVLLGLCGAGMSDAEIAMALTNSARLRSPELTSEIFVLAADVGLAMPKP
jgi:hypothetical protein